MANLNYLDFDLRIERDQGHYCARVIDAPAGQASTLFDLPFSALELENFLLRIERAPRGLRQIDSPEMAAAKVFGGRLFDAVFSGEVCACLARSLDEAARQSAGLRIRLHLGDTPELINVPWEFIYDPSRNRFLNLSTETPLVRYMDLPELIRPLAVKPPLRVLVMIASPSDFPPLNVQAEWAQLQGALADLQKRGELSVELLPEASLAVLQRALRHGEYHIFHFVGHGAFDESTQDGLLLFVDPSGRGRLVSGQYLGTLLHDHRSLRLAVLNACEGARSTAADPYAGVAQSLVQQGLPAVIAMQRAIGDEAAIDLSQEFYSALRDGYPVDAALAETRKSLYAQATDVEWATPVLYMRAPDGRIFDIAALPADNAAPVVSIPVTKPAVPRPTRQRRHPIVSLAGAGVSIVVILAVLLRAQLLYRWLAPAATSRQTQIATGMAAPALRETQVALAPAVPTAFATEVVAVTAVPVAEATQIVKATATAAAPATPARTATAGLAPEATPLVKAAAALATQGTKVNNIVSTQADTSHGKTDGRGTSIAYGQTVEGKIALPGEQGVFEFEGQSGDVVNIVLSHPPSQYVGLVLRGVDKQLASCDPIQGFVCEISAVTLPATGKYTIIADGYQDITTDYKLTLVKR